MDIEKANEIEKIIHFRDKILDLAEELNFGVTDLFSAMDAVRMQICIQHKFPPKDYEEVSHLLIQNYKDSFNEKYPSN